MSNERKPESIEEVYRWLCDGGWVVCKGDPASYQVRLHDGRFEARPVGFEARPVGASWWPANKYHLPLDVTSVRALIPAETQETLWQPVWSFDVQGGRRWYTSREEANEKHAYHIGMLKQTRVNGKCVSVEYVPGEVGE